MKDNEFRMCRCGHNEENHHWKKTSYYDGPEVFSNSFASGGNKGELRLQCRLCTCKRFNPSTSHKTKWFGLGIGIVVVFAIIYRMFVSG